MMTRTVRSDGLDLEVETDQGKDEAFQILDEIVEAAQSFRIFAAVHVDQGTDFGRCERNVSLAMHNFQLLAADPVRLRPHAVVLLNDVRVFDDAFQLFDHTLGNVHLLPDHGVVLVVGVVGVAELPVRPQFKLEELVSKLAPVTHVVTEIEILVSHVSADDVADSSNPQPGVGSRSFRNIRGAVQFAPRTSPLWCNANTIR